MDRIWLTITAERLCLDAVPDGAIDQGTAVTFAGNTVEHGHGVPRQDDIDALVHGRYFV